MNRTELENTYITNDDGTFTPLYIDVYRKEVCDYEYTIIKSSEEVYKEYLKNKNNPTKSQPTEVELLKKQLLETQNIIAQMQYNSLLNTK